MLNGMIDMYTIGVYAISCIVLSALAAYFLIYLQTYIPRLAGGEQHLNAIQSSHNTATPRVGGVAVFTAFVVVAAFSPFVITGGAFYLFVIACALFAIGLFGDLGFELRPNVRLILTVIACLVVVLAYGVWLPRMGIPFVDAYLHYWYIGIPITLLITAGVINGFNLIDGVNGLCGFTAVISLAALSFIASQAGYTDYSGFVYLLIFCVLGFLVVNFPSGKIFMGDAGAYTLGFVISWYAIAIIINAPQVSPWAVFLTVFWPVLDTLLAMFRRARRRRTTMAPDKLHVHQMVMRAMKIIVLSKGMRKHSNSLSTAVLLPIIIFIAICGVIFWDNNYYAFWATFAFLNTFWVGYFICIRVLSKYPRKPRS